MENTMSNSDEIRWRQRFDNFQKAFLLLKDALEKKPINEYSKLEQEGIIQRFEYTFELAWKTIKDKLFYEGYDEKTPRAVIRRSFAVEYLTEEEAETWLDSLDKRNLFSQTYNEKAAKEALTFIQEKFFPILSRLYQNMKNEIMHEQRT